MRALNLFLRQVMCLRRPDVQQMHGQPAASKLGLAEKDASPPARRAATPFVSINVGMSHTSAVPGLMLIR